MYKKVAMSLALVAGLGLSACSDPYDPGQRAVGGGLLGAGTGAALGSLAGGRGAAIGALVGGGAGALGGAATTPGRPQTYYQQPYDQQQYGQPVYQPAPEYYQPRPYGY
jgi:hypothetical protein